MHDALVRIADIEQSDAGGHRRPPRRDDEFASTRHDRVITAARQRVDDVVHGAEHLGRFPDRPPARLEALQRDAACALVEEDAIDVEQCRSASQIGNRMLRPDFFGERLRHRASHFT